MKSIEEVLDHIADKEKKMPKDLQRYFHTVASIEEDGYIIYLDEGEGNFINEKA